MLCHPIQIMLKNGRRDLALRETFIWQIVIHQNTSVFHVLGATWARIPFACKTWDQMLVYIKLD